MDGAHPLKTRHASSGDDLPPLSLVVAWRLEARARASWRRPRPDLSLTRLSRYGSTTGLTSRTCTAACPAGRYNDLPGARTADDCELPAGKNWCLSALAKNVRRSQRPPPFVAKSLHRRQVLPAGSLRDCHWPRDRVVRGRVRRSTRVRRLDPTRETLAWPSHFSCARARALSLFLSLSRARNTQTRAQAAGKYSSEFGLTLSTQCIECPDASKSGVHSQERVSQCSLCAGGFHTPQ